MGKFFNQDNNPKEVINKNIEIMKERYDSNYALFLDRTQTYTEYYHQNVVNSTVAPGLGNIHEVLGDESPIRFDRIDEMVIFFNEQFQTELESGDYGLRAGTAEGQAVVVPDTIVPYPNDLFIISYLDDRYLFKINNVNSDLIKSHKYFMIDFEFTKILDEDSKAQLMKQTVNESILMYNNIGTDYRSVIVKKDYTTAKNLDESLERIKDMYVNLYFDETFGLFRCKPDYLFIDPTLIRFIRETDLFVDRNKRKTYHSVTPFTNAQHHMMDSLYDKSFFKALLDKDKALANFKLTDYIENEIVDPASSLHYVNPTPKYALYVQKGTGVTTGVLSDTFIDDIKNNTKNSTHVYEHLIIDFFNDASLTDEMIKNITKFPSDDPFVDISKDKKLYYLIPIVIYVISHNIEKLMK